MKSLLFVFLLTCSVDALYSRRYKKEENLKDFPAQTFVQNLDHFNPVESRTFAQRYYVNDKYFNSGSQESPILLYINGEGPVSSPPYLDDDLVVILAKKFGALIVTLEHRYYGISVPFTSLTTPNLKWLNTRQALADLSYFITNFKTQRKLNERKVFTIGGSYSGALSAWFRVKFPNVTVGSLASSGVVNAVLDFAAFGDSKGEFGSPFSDEQVATSVGDVCAHVLRLTTRAIERLVLHSDQRTKLDTKARFNASMLTVDGDFFYLMADIMAESVQYDRQDELCDPLVQAWENMNEGDLVAAFVNYTVNYWYGVFGPPIGYSTQYQQDTSVGEEKADRQWWWQKCSELAYFQNAPRENAIRSQMVNMTYHRLRCAAVFGENIFPDTAATNAYYGGDHPKGTRIFFANGSQDPWKHASVTTALSPEEPAKVIECHNCGHCVDVRGCAGGCIPNSSNLEKARAEIINYVSIWLKL